MRSILSSWLGKEVELPVDEDLYLAELNKKIEEEKQPVNKVIRKTTINELISGFRIMS